MNNAANKHPHSRGWARAWGKGIALGAGAETLGTEALEIGSEQRWPTRTLIACNTSFLQDALCRTACAELGASCKARLGGTRAANCTALPHENFMFELGKQDCTHRCSACRWTGARDRFAHWNKPAQAW